MSSPGKSHIKKTNNTGTKDKNVQNNKITEWNAATSTNTELKKKNYQKKKKQEE